MKTEAKPLAGIYLRSFVKVPVHRLVFHEITEKAIKGALDVP